MSELLRTLDIDALNTVTGGSITGNASLGTTLLGPAYGLICGAASLGYEHGKHGSDVSKYDWGNGSW
jgi:hypothetical protein